MAQYFTHDLIIHLILFHAALLVVLLSNLVLLRRTRKHARPDDLPMVSILVPARNEEKSIGRCVQSLLTQDYPCFEVLVLDDQSSDDTPGILTQMAASQSRLKVLRGNPPPEGISGKNWACSQLAQVAQGELLFFTDADTIHQPQGLRTLVSAMHGERADLLTGFPRQQVISWGERLLVPFFQWAALCFFPLWLAYRVRWKALAVAVGQVMVFQREAYHRIGGHAALGTAIVDDLQLARNVMTAGLRWRVMRLSDLVSCHMYDSSREAVDGFTKNLFAAFDFRLLVYLFVFFWLLILFEAPLVILAVLVLDGAPLVCLKAPVVCLALSLLLWLIPYKALDLPIYLGLFFPFTILANVAVAFRSLVFSLTGRLTWKGRHIGQPKWKWL